MEVEGAASPPPKMWSLVRVTSPLLDSRKHWYVLTKNLCGTRPKDFSKNEIFKKFPGEINCVSTRELHPATKSCSLNRKAVGLYVATSFGLCAALLRQRELPAEGFISSREFLAVMNTVNSVALEFDPCSLGGKTYFGAQDQTPSPCFQTISAEIENWKSRFAVIEQEAFQLKARIAELEAEVTKLKNAQDSTSSTSSSVTNVCSTPVLPSRPSSSSSSPLSSCSSLGNSSIEETKKSSLGPTLKKREVARQCRVITKDLDGVCEKYHESLACVLGNSFIYGNEEDRQSVSKTVSDIIDLVINFRGSKKGLSELLLPETHQRFLESMRVPDWVLLYFKLQAKLPDAAWQTLLNLTQLGRSGVSFYCILILKRLKVSINLVFLVDHSVIS